jgi:hypothetical protein
MPEGGTAVLEDGAAMPEGDAATVPEGEVFDDDLDECAELLNWRLMCAIRWSAGQSIDVVRSRLVALCKRWLRVSSTRAAFVQWRAAALP